MPELSNLKTAATLRKTSLFAPLSETEVQSVATRASVKTYLPGELLFSEGESCLGLNVVMTGRIRIFKSSRTGREQVLAIEAAGGSVAELPIFDGGDYPASAVAIERSELIFVSREDFRAVCLANPEMALKLLQVVSSRLRRLVNIIEELSFTTLRQRLITWLLREAKLQGRPGLRGVTFHLGITHQEIAAQIGTVRELVSRNMARLQAEGLIETNGHQITILDQSALESDLTSQV